MISSTEALSLDKLPWSLAIVGAGYIGLELGIAFRKMGAEVTVVEALDRILPLYDKALNRSGAQMAGSCTQSPCTPAAPRPRASKGEASARVRDHGRSGDAEARRADVHPGHGSAGVRGTKALGPGDDGRRHGRPFVKIDDQCRTSMRDVWAIGDIAGEPDAGAQGLGPGRGGGGNHRGS